MVRLALLCVLLVAVVARPKALVRLDVTVNNRSVELVLRERETLLQAALKLCDSDRVALDKEAKPVERDKCVVDAITTMGTECRGSCTSQLPEFGSQ
jgi:hypothetical protein